MDFNPDTCHQLLMNCLARVRNHPDRLEKLFACRVLKTSLLKKWLPPDSSPLDSKAKQVFLACNAHCGSLSFNDTFDTDLYRVLRTARDELHRSFHSGELQSNILSLQACLAMGRCGPGSSVGTKLTDFFGKMCESTLTFTDEGLYHLYKNNTNAAWFEMDLVRSRNHGERLVEGSNSTTVPKDSNTNRMICTEPSLNMFFQLGAGAVIEGILKKVHNIDLSTQPEVNKAFARCGSIMGIYATIDLKSASDTISTALMEYLLPVDVFRNLDAIRSKKTKIDGKYHELNLFSSMGNGFTFPLQTLVFATLVRATYEHMGIKPLAFGPSRNYGVFGDDIICLSQAYVKLTEILSGCGFTVNLNKSYAAGSFRESCGGDYFRGAEVRGVYLRKIESHEDIYSIFNRLVRWSIKHQVGLSDVLEYLLGLAKFRPVPFDASDTAGFKYPSAYLTNPKRDRQGCLKYRASEPVANQVKLASRGTGDVWEGNTAGLLIAYLGGFVENSFAVRHTVKKKRSSPESNLVKYEYHTQEHRVTLRTLDRVTWKIVRRKTPSWDFIPHVGLKIQDYEQVWMTLSLNN